MATRTAAVRSPEATRRKILEAAFLEFYAHGFQAGSLNDVVSAAGTTKGAVFHHFDNKQELGYAVVDEIIGPLLLQRWLDPVVKSDDPLTEMQAAFKRYVEEDISSGIWLQGCPMNNLAQEMSSLDAGFHQRIGSLYDLWRDRYSAALRRGIGAGTVKRGVDADSAAALIVAAQMGLWGTGKSSRETSIMRRAAAAVHDYLESLRP